MLFFLSQFLDLYDLSMVISNKYYFRLKNELNS